MKGIYKKDLLQIAKGWKVELAVSLLGIAGMIYFDVYPGLISFFAVFWMMQAASTVIADRTSGWYSYSTCFPYTRKKQLFSKYWLTAGFGALGFVLGIVITWICRQSHIGSLMLDSTTLQINIAIALIITFSAAALVIPTCYLFKKSQFFSAIALSFVPAAAMIMFWSSQIEQRMIQVSDTVQAAEVNLNLPLLWILSLISFLLFLISSLVMPGLISRQDQ